MYRYNEIDQAIVDARVDEFRGQTQRFISGEIDEGEFLQLRLRNGLYVQKHAPMLRIAIPYGLMNATQLRMLAHVARKYDRGYGHFTTRQNLQLNWPKLEEVPDILQELATVQLHAIQTSGNCVRNTTNDPLSGVAPDEIADPRPYCELIRQWSTSHPEFNWLPRKFKIAFSGREHDDAATAVHDIGVRIVRRDGVVGFQVLAGGGLGRTPVLAKVVREFLPEADLLSYVESILRVYNLGGDRKNKYKARIKILVQRMGIELFREKVEAEFALLKDGPLKLSEARLDDAKAAFEPPAYRRFINGDGEVPKYDDASFNRWVDRNTVPHRLHGYRAVFISLKARGRPPGDITSAEMELVADLADTYSFGEIQATHEQNLIFPHVETHRLVELWLALDEHGLAPANIGTLTDMICCPGMDFCALANTHSIPIALELQERFDDLDQLYDLGDIQLKMSGCINACGHHHVGHIGILGIDKKGEEWFQVQLGGSATDDAGDGFASLGEWIGPAVSRDRVVDVVEMLLDTYVEQRTPSERFLDTYRRVGMKPFHDAVFTNAEGGRLCVRT